MFTIAGFFGPVMVAEPGARDAALLTRTTLQVDEGLLTPSIAQVIHALQRVPGVLLAEIITGTAARSFCTIRPKPMNSLSSDTATGSC